jgi:hypothetical protein
MKKLSQGLKSCKCHGTSLAKRKQIKINHKELEPSEVIDDWALFQMFENGMVTKAEKCF